MKNRSARTYPSLLLPLILIACGGDDLSRRESGGPARAAPLLARVQSDQSPTPPTEFGESGPAASGSDQDDAAAHDPSFGPACLASIELQIEANRACLAYERKSRTCTQFSVQPMGHPGCVLAISGDSMDAWRWIQPAPDEDTLGEGFCTLIDGTPATEPGLAVAFEWSPILAFTRPTSYLAEEYEMEIVSLQQSPAQMVLRISKF